MTDTAHAIELLREAYENKPWDASTMIGVDPQCCFGASAGQHCGEPSTVAVVLKEIDDAGVQLLLLCDTHAGIMEEAMVTWREAQAKRARA